MAKNPTVAVVAPVVVSVPHIQLTGVVPTYKSGTARALWLARLQDFNNKPVAEFVASCTQNPPSLPTKGKSAGVVESPQGWLRWFAKSAQGVAVIVNL